MLHSDDTLMTADARLPSLRLRQSQSRAEWRSPPYSTLLFIASSMCSLLNLNFSRAVYRSWRHKQDNLNATFSHGNKSQCQRDVFVFTSNFLVVSLPDMGPLSPFSSLKSLISLMIFFSRSAWMVTCFKRPNHYQRFQCFSVRISLDKMGWDYATMYSILLCYKLHNRQTEGNQWLTLRMDLSETPPVSTWAALARL